MTRAYYFGCWRQVGHCFWLPGMSGSLEPLSPWGYDVERLCPAASTAQGAAALHHKDGWTALAVHDYTVDHRGNSKSVFVFDADLDFDAALSRAREAFPDVVERVGTIGGVV